MTRITPGSEAEHDGRLHIVGTAPAIDRALQLSAELAPTHLPILLLGETGTGKELFARRVHELSGRKGGFVDVNCGALPRDLVESLLFGHDRGAFTGAVDCRAGLVEAAAGGTLFLDELSSLPRQAQAKLLRVLESGEVRRVGETRNRYVNFRLVAAAQSDLQERTRAGDFRPDLFHRVAGVVLQLPPLSERREDLPALVDLFATRCGARLDRTAVSLLIDHPWPGNVRELKAAVERAVALAPGSLVTGETIALALDLGPSLADASNGNGAQPVAVQRARLERVCEENAWDAQRIAEALGIGRTTLFKRLKEVGLSLRR